MSLKMVVKINETLWNGNRLKEVRIATILMFRKHKNSLIQTSIIENEMNIIIISN